jgi:NADH:ubiquinone oxidoreductase subunit F (NADH-binding)
MEKASINKITDKLVNKLLANSGSENSPEFEEIIEKLLRHKPGKPVIYIGTGTCGIAAGADKTLAAVQDYLQKNEIDAEVAEVGCIGLCSAEPLMDFQTPGKARVSFREVTAEEVAPILDGCFSKHIPKEKVLGQFRNEQFEYWENVPLINDLPFFKKQQRVLLHDCGEIAPDSLDEYLAREGYQSFVKTILNYPPHEVIGIVKESGLKGRGGGGYLAANKWKVACETFSDKKYLVCNADESDPGAYMDRALIEGNPHKLIEGIAIAAYAIGASKAYIYIRHEYHLAVNRLKNAVHQAREAGVLGDNIFKSGFNLQLILRESPGAFVCGEETALIKSLEGRRGMPRSKPPYPTEKGLFGKPTVVNNVETLFNVPGILQHGPQWFKKIGSQKSNGTKLFALTGDTVNTGLVEVPFGITIEELIYEIGGGIKNDKKFKAVQIGGPSGSLIPEKFIDLSIDYDLFTEKNLIMGSGGFVIMDDSTCIVDMVKYFIDFLQKESCGKCIPCREGTNRMYEILKAITNKPVDGASHGSLNRFRGVMQLESLAEVIKETSLCGLGKTAPNPVLSALKHFREEFEEHIYERKCRTNVCKNLRSFIISFERCTGCMICAKKCPEDAIVGTARHPHMILSDKCTSCGICYDVCKFNAIDVV